MSSFKLGVELKKMVYKRRLGGGEFSYVSFATGEERRGKVEILDLLVREEGWGNFLLCKGSGESEDSFMKKVKKQIQFVLFDDQAANATHRTDQSFVDHRGNQPANASDAPKCDTDVESKPKKRKAKAGPASKVKRARSESESESPVPDIGESNNLHQDNLKKSSKDSEISEDLDVTVPFEGNHNHIEDSSDRNEQLEDTVEYFESTSSPPPIKEEEIGSLQNFDIEANNDETTDLEEVNEERKYSNCDEDRRVLVFNLNKAESHSSCKSFFAQFNSVEDIKRTKTRKNSSENILIYKGVYLITFETVLAAEEFISSKVVFKDNELFTILLSQHKRETFFQRSVQKGRVVQRKHEAKMSQLKDLKRDGKLANCVSVMIHSDNLSDDQVQEFFCGISSDFIDNFGKPVEEARKVSKQDKNSFPEYVLVFEEEADAQLFVNKPEFHKFGNLKMGVALLTVDIKKIKFSQKPKNFIDDKEFNDKDNTKRIAIQTVNKLKSPQEIETFFRKQFSNLINVHRCEINRHFIGLYILSFETESTAHEATKIDCEMEGFVKNSMITKLDQYLAFREKYLNMKEGCPKKMANHNINTWKVDYEKLAENHKEHYGDIDDYDGVGEVTDIEKKYKTLCDQIEKDNASDFDIRKPGVRNISTFDLFIVCKGFPAINERSKREIEEYFFDNHENVEYVRFSDLVFVKFSDAESAHRFLTLNYIRYLGNKVHPHKLFSYFESIDYKTIEDVKAVLCEDFSANYSDNT